MKTPLMLGLALTIATPALAQMAAPSPKTYVMKAGAGDLYERQSSQLELRSANPKIRTFAAHMVRDHAKSTADVKAAAMRAGMRPAPAMLNPMQREMMARLRAAHGAARDRLYIEQQKTAHQQALTLHQDYAANGTSAPLKMAAAKIAPVVQSHIDMLNAM